MVLQKEEKKQNEKFFININMAKIKNTFYTNSKSD